MANVKIGEIKYDEDDIWEVSVDIALDTAAELSVLTASKSFTTAKDLLLKSSLTMMAGSALASVSAMGSKIASAFSVMEISNANTSSIMMVSEFLNNDASMTAIATAGTAGVIGTVAALSVKNLVKAFDDISIKLDPTLISKRQSQLAEAYGEIFEFGEKQKNDRSKDNLVDSYETLRPIAEQVGFKGDKMGDHIIYEYLSNITNEKMTPDDPDMPRILNSGKF